MYNTFFEQLEEFPIVVCRECRHAVWPSQIETHLRRAHRYVSTTMRVTLADDVRTWPNIAHDPIELNIPATRTTAIQQLVAPVDGYRCQLSSHSCQYICTTMPTMRQHWIKHHQWSRTRKIGQPTHMEQKQIQHEQDQACRPVQCQRLFPVKANSQYFAIIPETDEAVAPDGDACETLIQNMQAHWRSVQEAADRKIQAGQVDEANPWLRRTEWVKYLGEFDIPDLIQSVSPPPADIDGQPSIEPEAHAIWTAMARLATISQLSVIHQIGVFVRLEAIRTEQHQTRYTPLEAYQDEESIVKQVRPWQEMLMFFWRTQQPHEWTSPPYRFTRRQRMAWERLVDAVRIPPTRQVSKGKVITRSGATRAPWVEEEEEEEGEEEEEEEEERDTMSIDSLSVDSNEPDFFNDRSDGIEKTMEETAMGRTVDVDAIFDIERPPENEEEASNITVPPLSPVERACLDFCIELLNQRITRREYDSALVCAAAVLGVREGGFRTPEDYPPILSRVIKVARFMVVKKAVELSDEPEEEDAAELPSSMDHTDWDSAYGGSPPPSSPGRKGCLQWVTQMMDRFMVRGSQGPTQWMLDLRTYGLKIHYNTTSAGHVQWQNGDELCYKDRQFTMNEFRGMVHAVVQDARRILIDDILGCPSDAVPAIPWDRLYDDPSNNQARWSFLQDTRTQWPVDGEHWMWHRIRQDPAVRRRFIQADGQGFHPARWMAYQNRITAFLEKLLVAIQFTWGQPARAPELLSIRHENSPMGGIRNMFIEDGMVVLVAQYHKGYQLSGDVKIIHRYLPREVGELLVWYLWLVQPFERVVSGNIYQRDQVSSHIWTAHPHQAKWNSERLRHILQRESAMGLRGQSLHIASYREVAIAISRRYLRNKYRFAADDGDDPEAMDEVQLLADAADRQAGHDPHTAGGIYARESRELFGAMASMRERYRGSSQDWHTWLGFASCQPPSDPDADPFSAPPASSTSWFTDEAQRSREERWQRMQRMDVDQALRDMMGPDAAFRGPQKQIVQAVIQGQSPVIGVMPTGGGKSLLFMLPAWMARGGTTVVIIPLVSLRDDLQRRCAELDIQCVAWNNRQPADGASIVLITPESAVRDETFSTFLNRKQFTGQLDRIVIDECHIALHDQYDFRKSMTQLGQLVRYRAPMLLLTATMPREDEERLCQRMYFPPSTVHWIRARTSRHNIAYRVVRIARPQEHGRRGDVGAAIMAWIEQEIPRYSPGKVVVYANSRHQTEQVAEALGCGAYHSHTIDRAGMLSTFRQTPSGVIVATSALGMGIDIPDIRCVIHVGRPRSLLDYAQESGRAGRDGQGSTAVMVLDGSGGGWGDPVTDRDAGSLRALEQVQRYIDQPCRRGVFDPYLDGEVDGYQRQQCEEGEAACDGCCAAAIPVETQATSPTTQSETPAISPARRVQVQARSPVPAPARSPKRKLSEAFTMVTMPHARRRGYNEPWEQLRSHIEREARTVDSIREHFDRWVGRCRICAMHEAPSEHFTYQCPRAEGQQAAAWIEETIRKVTGNQREDGRNGYEDYAVCFQCHSPQWICPRWVRVDHGGYQRTKEACRYLETAAHTMAQLLHGPMREVIQPAWERRVAQMPGGGVPHENQAALIRHFQRKFGKRGEERSGLVEEMTWMCSWVDDTMQVDVESSEDSNSIISHM